MGQVSLSGLEVIDQPGAQAERVLFSCLSAGWTSRSADQLLSRRCSHLSGDDGPGRNVVLLAIAGGLQWL